MTETFPVAFSVDARATGKMRCEMRVTYEPEGPTFEVASDEGEFHGGEGTAPTPLSYFTAAVAGCLMTQIRAFSRRLDVPVGEVRIRGEARWSCELDGRKPYVSRPERFLLDVDLDSEAPLGAQVRLVEAATKGCFVEQTLVRENTVLHRLEAGDEYIGIEEDAADLARFLGVEVSPRPVP